MSARRPARTGTQDLHADLMADLAGPAEPVLLPGQEPLVQPAQPVPAQGAPAPLVPGQPGPAARRPVPALDVSLTPTRWSRPRLTATGLKVGPVSLGLTRR